MKKHRGIRIAVIVSIILMIMGSLCIGVGIASGGDLRYLHVGKDTVSWWPFQGTFGIGFGDYDTAFWLDDDETDTASRWEQHLQEVTSLTLDIRLGDVRIERGSENKISFLHIRKQDVSVDNKQGVITAKVENSDVLRNNRKDAVIITLKDAQYDRIQIDNKLGDVQIHNLSARHIGVEEKLGDISLKDIISNDLTIKQSAGDIEVEGRLMGNSIIKSSMGDIEVQVHGSQEDYRYKVKNSMGDTQIQQHDYDVHCDVEEGNSSSKNYIQLHSSMGDIELHFAS